MILFPNGSPTARESLHDYLGIGGYQAVHGAFSAEVILAEIEASGLRGRGGAAFPVGRKWRIAAETPADKRYVVVNAGEDEPGSFKDRLLLEHRPHLVLEGAILAARAIGATEIILYINETYDDAIVRMTQAIEEARQHSALAELTVRIARAPTVYVAGEDSACLEVLEGRKPWPRQKPPYPATSGLFGKPTVVNNVESLANVGFIVRHGAAWFRQYGTAESPGSMIFCLGEEVNRPGGYELPMGTPLRQLLQDVGGGLKAGTPIKAVLPGGPSCAFLTGSQLDVHLDPESLKAVGSSLGCGVMRFYPEGTCMVEETLKIAQFFAQESCGQCPACRMETSMLAAALDRVRQGTADRALLDQIPKIVEFNRGKGYCALINMPGAPVLRALRLFRSDFDHHLQHGACPSV